MSEKRRHESIYSHHAVSNHDLRRIAVTAECDPRSVVKYLRGVELAPMLRGRIERALASTGFDHLVIKRTASSPPAALDKARSNGAPVVAAASGVAKR